MRNLARRRKGEGRRANAIRFFHLGAEEEEEEEPFFFPFVGKRGKGGKRLNWCRDEGKGERERGQKQTARGGRELCALPHSPTPPSLSVCGGGGGGRDVCGVAALVWNSTLFHSAREENVTETKITLKKLG